jgi:heavy metal efflux system protein
MLQTAARYSTHHPKTILLLMAVFVALGVYAFRTLSIEAYPDVTDPMVEIVTVYPGQSAEEVERRVSLELERVLAGTPHLTNLRTVSVFGLSLVTLRFDDEATDFEHRVHVMERLREAELPEGVEAEIGPLATPVGQIYRYTLRGPRSLRELRSLQDWVVERRLRSVPGVADVDTFGGFERQYAVRIDPMRLASMGVSIPEVFEAVEATNANAPGGYVGIGSQEFVVRGLGTMRSPADIGAALVKEVDGVPIRIRDVADVVESSVPRRGAVGRGEEDEVVEGIVLLRRGENPSVVLADLQDRIDELNGGILPSDVKIDTFYDRRELIDETVSTVGHNLLHGAILVVVIVLVFLRSWQAAVIVAVVIPLALLTSFIGLRALGMSANLISLGAIDFGILVENAAVVLEVTLHALGVAAVTAGTSNTLETRRRAIVDAVATVSRPVGFATLIIIAGLVPLFMLERVEGRIFRPMAYTYVFALVGARIAATTVVPAMMSLMLSGKVPHGEVWWFRWIQAAYARLLGILRRARAVVVIAALGLLTVAGTYARDIGTEFLPELNEGGLYITAVFPSTVALDETARNIPEIRQRMMALPEARDVLSHLGRPEDARQTEGPNNVEFFVKLAPLHEWRSGMRVPELEAELRESLSVFPGVQFNFSQPITDRVFETISGIVGQVVVKVKGEDLDQMTDLADQIQDRLRHVDGVADLSVFQAGDVPQLSIELDRARLAERGLAVDEVQAVIDVALGGKVATELWEGERRYGVALRLTETVRRDPDALGRLVVSDTGERITLAEVADITLTRGRAFIWRENLSRFVAIKFNVNERDLGSVVRDARAAIEDMERPEGVTVEWGGEFENQQRAMARLATVVPLTLTAMIGILFVNFRRWKPTLLILALLPLSGLCSIAFLRLTGEHFSVSAAIGVITLLGQVTLSGVLVCTRIDLKARIGAADPVIEGACVALRPVMLTVCLAAFGLVPLAFSDGMGSESQRPFAIALIGGLIAAFPMVMLLMPLFYRPPENTSPGASDPPRRIQAGAGYIVGCLILGATLLGSGVAHAAPPTASAPEPEANVASPSVTLDALLARWLSRGKEVESWRSEIGAAKFDIVTASLLPNPSIALETMGTVVGLDTPPDGIINWGAEVETELPIFGQRRARRTTAIRALDVAEMFVAQLVWERAADIREAAVERAFAEQQVELFERALAELSEIRRVIGSRAEAGVAPRYDAMRVEILNASLEADAASARVDRDLFEARLVSAIADPTLRAAPIDRAGLPRLSGRLDEASLLKQALELRPDVLLARRGELAKLAEARQFRVEARPTPSLSVGTYVTHIPRSGSLRGEVSVPLPIFDRNQGLRGRANAEARGHADMAIALEARIEVEVYGAVRNRQRAQQALARFEESGVLVTADLLGRAWRAYEGGQFSVVELLDAYEAVWDAREKELELDHALVAAEAELLRAAGLMPDATE